MIEKVNELAVQFYLAVGAGAAWAFQHHKDKPLFSRTVIVAISGMMGVSMSPDLSTWSHVPLPIVGGFMTAFGFLALDLLGSLISDRDLMKDLIRKYLIGVKKEGGSE